MLNIITALIRVVSIVSFLAYHIDLEAKNPREDTFVILNLSPLYTL